MCFVDWFYERFYDGFMVLCRGSRLRTINEQRAWRTTSWSNVRRVENLYKFLNHAGASLIATGLAASTLDPLFQNQTEYHKSEFDSLPRHHPRRKSDAKEGLITSSCRPETVGPISDFSRLTEIIKQHFGVPHEPTPPNHGPEVGQDSPSTLVLGIRGPCRWIWRNVA